MRIPRFFYLVLSLFLGVPPAGGAGEKSKLTELFSAPTDLDFSIKWQGLSPPLREEWLEIISTPLAGWKALREWDRAPWEKLSLWAADKNQAGQDYADLKFLGLGHYPVPTKIKLEKHFCSVPPLAPTKNNFFQKVYSSWRCKLFPKYCLENVSCENRLEWSLALDLMGAPGLVEEKQGSLSLENIALALKSHVQEANYRKKLWTSLERLYTRLPAYRQSLPARIRVVELSSPQLNEEIFERLKKLTYFLQAQNSGFKMNCESLEKIYAQRTFQKSLADEAQCPTAQRTPIRAQARHNDLSSEAKLAASKGLTSLFMVDLQKRLSASRRSGIQDLRGEAAAVVIKGMQNPRIRAQLKNEKMRLKKLAVFWSNFSEAGAEPLSKFIEVQKAMAAALHQEVESRL